jgi:nicotinamidase-related amidase
MDVPVFLLMRACQKQKTVHIDGKAGQHLPRRFLLEEHSCPWSDKSFVEALDQEDRSILLFAGSWLEHEVLGTALHGLAEGYDACVLLDATAARSHRAAQPAQERLTQAGGTPVVTSQVLHEWLVQASNSTQRAALQGLLSAVMPE